MTALAARARALRAIAGEFNDATSGTPSRRAGELVPGLDLADAYAVQALDVRHRRAAGAVPVGYMVGLTSTAMQQQMGALEPDSGVLFADRQVPDGGQLATRGMFTPRVEAELAVHLGADLPMSGSVDDHRSTPAADRALGHSGTRAPRDHRTLTTAGLASVQATTMETS